MKSFSIIFFALIAISLQSSQVANAQCIFADLEDGTGASGVYAVDISHNAIVGTYEDSEDEPHSFIYKNGIYSNLDAPTITTTYEQDSAHPFDLDIVEYSCKAGFERDKQLEAATSEATYEDTGCAVLDGLSSRDASLHSLGVEILGNAGSNSILYANSASAALDNSALSNFISTYGAPNYTIFGDCKGDQCGARDVKSNSLPSSFLNLKMLFAIATMGTLGMTSPLLRNKRLHRSIPYYANFAKALDN